jgi:pimeloyl-ACP methyl ester carboxylesterase
LSGQTRPPLLFVHGAFCGGWCFDSFRVPFEAEGWRVSAPDLPGHAAGDAPAAVAGRSLGDYTRALIDEIELQPEPPVLVAHSMGGLVAQLAASRRKVAGLILLAPSPAWGQPVASPIEMAAGGALLAARGPYWMEAVAPDWSTVRAMTFNRLAPETARTLFARMIPESGRALFEVLNWWIDPSLASLVPPIAHLQPSLVVAGGADQIHTAPTVAVTALRLGAESRVMAPLSHWMLDEPEAPELAATCLEWLDRVIRR